MFALLLHLIALYCILVAGQKCNTSRDIKPITDLIGEPVYKIETTWKSLNQTFGSPVTYRVFYFKTSRLRDCSCLTWHSNLGDPQCIRQSSRPDEELRCVLNEDTIKSLNITLNNFIKGDTICIVVEGSYQNTTWYNFAECTTPIKFGSYCTSTCPAPDNIQVNATKNRTLTVIFDVSRYVSGLGLHNIGFHIFYRPVQQQSISPKEFQKITLTNDVKKFTVSNNQHDIVNLEPFIEYEVQICCFYYSQPAGRCPHSGSYFARTLEEAPIRAPVVSEAQLQENNLLSVKFQLPPPTTRNGRLVRYEVEVWQGSDNCMIFDPKRIIIKRNITKIDVTRGSIYFNVMIHQGDKCCFRINICTFPGCSPWSQAHFVQSTKIRTPSSKTKPQGKSYTAIVVVSVACILILTTTAAVVYRCKFKRRTSQPTELPDLGDADSLTSTTDIDDHPLDDNIYAAVDHEDLVV